MSRIKNPLFSFDARNTLGKAITFVKRRGQNIAEKRPEIKDGKTAAQLSWRHMYQKCAALWHDLSAAEQADWNSLGGVRHMTGFAYWQSQCLRPNPGIYLPLQGGTMQGIIDMDGFAIQDLLDPAAAQDADTKAARDAAIAAAIGGSLDCDVHGYDGANWQKLLVESAALHNLRVKLYDGAAGIDSTRLNTQFAETMRGQIVAAGLYAHNATFQRLLDAVSASVDARSSATWALEVASFLYGYNGASFDRLRSYPTGILKVGRAEVGLSDIAKVGVGAVKAGPGKLYWMTMNPTAAASVIELSDDLDGSTAYRWRMLHGANAAHHMNLDPPMEFTTGIWLKTFTNMDSIIFGYL